MNRIYYYFYTFTDDLITYYLPIRKEIPVGHIIKPDYFDNQLFQELKSKFQNVRIEGYYVYERNGIELIDRYLTSYAKGNQKELRVYRTF
jgi:hypothetical protein